MLHDVTVTTGEIRDAWSEIQAGRNPFSDRQAKSATVLKLPRYRGATVDPFVGASGSEIQDRLQNGYWPEGLEVELPGGAVEIAQPFVDLVEEDGDLILSQALGGEDLMYAQWEPTEAPRGLTIRACIGMHAGVTAKVIGDYMTWILKVVDAAERKGIAPDVELWIGTKNGFIDSQDQMTVRIPLVKAGELIDAVAWRAFMAPGAFRSLGFVAFALGADKAGRRLNSGMGSPTNRDWKVEFADDTLDIECPGGAPSFPAELLDAKLEAAGA
jgi:hypothetical protein